MLEVDKNDLYKFYRNNKPFFLLIQSDYCNDWMLMKDSIEIIEDNYALNFIVLDTEMRELTEDDVNAIMKRFGLTEEDEVPCAVFYDGSSLFIKQGYMNMVDIENLVNKTIRKVGERSNPSPT